MRAVVQRVSESSVIVSGHIAGSIGEGLLVLLGIAGGDTEKDAEYLAEKIVHLRIFDDEQGKMNLSLIDKGGSILVVSQFTLYGDARKGRRPSYIDAARPETANVLYEYFVNRARSYGVPVETGVFQAHMNVELNNDGPVTVLLDSRRTF